VVAVTREGARAPSRDADVCAEPGCELPRWTVRHRRHDVACSEFCYGHAQVPLDGSPPAPAKKPKPAPKRSADAVFRKEVARRHAERERAAVKTRAVNHPAQFSKELLPALERPLAEWHLPVHDPFAGTGERLGQLCDQLGLTFTGTEIEPEWIVDARVRHGDSTEAGAYPTGEYVVATSPTYPNGMSDHFKASDHKGRNTYRHALQRTNGGQDRELHPNNSGRYGVRYHTDGHYWKLMQAAVAHWPALVIVNVKDFITGGKVYRLVEKWTELLREHGYDVVEQLDVACPGNRFGANRDDRVETEAVLVAHRAAS
jgi:hypothetical protein